jgi:hypothetical protein
MLVTVMVLLYEAVERGLVVLRLAGRLLADPAVEFGLEGVDVPAREIGADALDAVVREGAQEGTQQRQLGGIGALLDATTPITSPVSMSRSGPPELPPC